MHYSKILIASAAFIQGSLSTGILVYSGRDCTGSATARTVDSGVCTGPLPVFRSYRENGWGPKGKRISFYGSGTCTGETFLYDTWSNNGDYFQSRQCYNIDGHSPNGEKTAASVSQN
ncbi:hypothetical protein BDV59DRAFT_174609 [Aspergillus ambiguus]|uniref:uncharacterized protein n=1 Tax=Aspergillus ambiguus TaxID=176160 RepID=UPI003CCD459C